MLKYFGTIFCIYLLLFSHQGISNVQFKLLKKHFYLKNRDSEDIIKNNICLEGTR